MRIGSLCKSAPPALTAHLALFAQVGHHLLAKG